MHRFTTPPLSPSPRRQEQPAKTNKSISFPQHRSSSSSIDESTRKPTTSSKSLMAPTYVPTPQSTVDFDRDLDYQLQIQKLEYEATIQRHIKFIDQVR